MHLYNQRLLEHLVICLLSKKSFFLEYHFLCRKKILYCFLDMLKFWSILSPKFFFIMIYVIFLILLSSPSMRISSLNSKNEMLKWTDLFYIQINDLHFQNFVRFTILVYFNMGLVLRINIRDKSSKLFLSSNVSHILFIYIICEG